jgi:competence protein ComEA
MKTPSYFVSYIKALMIAFFLVFAPAAFAIQEANPVTVQQEQVDINSADAATLAQVLDGIGMTKALEIVAYREMHGKFETIEQLAEVKGIGMATVEKNRHRVLIVKD